MIHRVLDQFRSKEQQIGMESDDESESQSRDWQKVDDNATNVSMMNVFDRSFMI